MQVKDTLNLLDLMSSYIDKALRLEGRDKNFEQAIDSLAVVYYYRQYKGDVQAFLRDNEQDLNGIDDDFLYAIKGLWATLDGFTEARVTKYAFRLLHEMGASDEVLQK